MFVIVDTFSSPIQERAFGSVEPSDKHATQVDMNDPPNSMLLIVTMIMMLMLLLL